MILAMIPVAAGGLGRAAPHGYQITGWTQTATPGGAGLRGHRIRTTGTLHERIIWVVVEPMIRLRMRE